MKKLMIVLLAVAVVSGLALTGCPKDPAAALRVSTKALHFGTQEVAGQPGVFEYVTQMPFLISNSGDEGTVLAFSVTANEPWITVNPGTGQSTSAQDAQQVMVTIDREYAEAAAKALDFSSGLLTIEATIATATVDVTTAPDYHTEAFGVQGNDIDLGGNALTFSPNGGLSYYDSSLAPLAGGTFPTDPAGGLILDFGALGDPVQAAPLGGKTLPFYGENFDTLYISSEGWVSFGAPGDSAGTLGEHFANVQISAFPVDATQAGSMVSFLQDQDKLAITYENAPTAGIKQPSPNDFQIELFFNGDIRLSYVDVDPAVQAVIGLSSGVGQGGVQPTDFIQTDFNTNPVKAAL